MTTNEKKLRMAKEERVAKLLETREFKMIKLNKITVPSTLGIDSDTELDTMTEELLEHGLLSPISVVGPYEDGVYKVIEGARRIKSLNTFLRGNKIPCYIVAKAVSDKQMQLLALAANRVHRKDDTSLNIKYAQIIFDECVEGTMEERHAASALAHVTGMSTRQARTYMVVTKKGSDGLKDAVAQSKLPVNLAATITKATEDCDQQDRIADAVKGSPKRDTKAFAENIKKGEFNSTDPKELKKKADRIREEEARRRRSNEIEAHIRLAEKSLEFLHALDPKADAKKMAHLVDLCGQICDLYD